MGALRDHGDDAEPRYRLLNGGMAAPCMHAGGVVASSQTTASWVADLRPHSIRHWVTGTSAPCTALFKPVRVEDALDLGPLPTDRADAGSLWWRHERLQRRVMRDPVRLRPLFTAERDSLEARWRAEPPIRGSVREGDRLLVEWTARVIDAAGPDARRHSCAAIGAFAIGAPRSSPRTCRRQESDRQIRAAVQCKVAQRVTKSRCDLEAVTGKPGRKVSAPAAAPGADQEVLVGRHRVETGGRLRQLAGERRRKRTVDTAHSLDVRSLTWRAPTSGSTTSSDP